MSAKKKVRRQRGVVLTPAGLERFKVARQAVEAREYYGEPLSLEQIAEQGGEMDVHTVRRALSGTERVDIRTLTRLFQGFALELEPQDYDKPVRTRHQDWGQAAFKVGFWGRECELETLTQWIGPERCRLVTIYGAPRIGKTALARAAAEQWQDRFATVVWRSLRDPVSPERLLRDLLTSLDPDGRAVGETVASFPTLLARLLDRLVQKRCLLALDGLESLFRIDNRADRYRPDRVAYGEILKQISLVEHQSCLLLTTQVKPSEVAVAESESGCVRSLRLDGLLPAAVGELLAARSLKVSPEACARLTAQYGGNPAILSLVATTINEVFGGDAISFVGQNFSIYGELHELLAAQFARLSAPERDVLAWLAIAREPVSLTQLRQDTLLSAAALIEALESLLRQAAIERQGNLFVCQPLVRDYVTEYLLSEISNELATGKLHLLHKHALYRAQGPDALRAAQKQVFLGPLLDRLAARLRSHRQVAVVLSRLIVALQEPQKPILSYAAGNLVNLLCQFGITLTNWDLSGLALWQADFEHQTLQGCNLQRADLRGARFAQSFSGICDLAFSPDGQLFAAGDSSGELHIFRARDGERLNCIRQGEWLWSIAFSPDGRIVASGDESGNIELWDVAAEVRAGTLHGHRAKVRALQFAPDGRTLASGSDDGTIRLWNLDGDRSPRVLTQAAASVAALCFSADGRVLASSDGASVRLWQVASGDCIDICPGLEDQAICALAYYPQGDRLAIGGTDGTVAYYDPSAGSEKTRLLSAGGDRQTDITALAMSPDGAYLASSSSDGTVCVWDLQTDTCITVLQDRPTVGIVAVAFGADSRTLACGSFDSTIQLWDISGDLLYRHRGRGRRTRGIAFDRTGSLLAAGHQDGTDLWNPASGDRQRELAAAQAYLTAVDFSPDGDHIVGGSLDGEIRVWETGSGRSLAPLQGQRERTLSLAFSPDNRWLASSSSDLTVAMWDWERRQQHQEYRPCDRCIWTLDFCPNSERLACGSHDGTVWMLAAATGECLWHGEHHSLTRSVAFSPDGCRLASGSQDGSVRIWDTETGECLHVIEVGRQVSTVVYSADGCILVVGRGDGKIDLWDPDTGRWLRTLPGHDHSVRALTVSPSDNTLASIDGNDAVLLWDLEAPTCLRALRHPRPYEEMDITGATGLTATQIQNLRALGAIWQEGVWQGALVFPACALLGARPQLERGQRGVLQAS